MARGKKATNILRRLSASGAFSSMAALSVEVDSEEESLGSIEDARDDDALDDENAAGVGNASDDHGLGSGPNSGGLALGPAAISLAGTAGMAVSGEVAVGAQFEEG